jgi:D-tyrosyl-tRNA(Tyr) deacylase
MRAVIQRASGAGVVVDGADVARFEGPGLVVLVGVTHTDTADTARRLADKILDLRIFEQRHGVLVDAPASRELSAGELELPILVVSQFTLYGDIRKGRRPTWAAAAPGAVAEPLVDAVVASLRARGAIVGTGVFGADMRVELVNDGPMTLVVDID